MKCITYSRISTTRDKQNLQGQKNIVKAFAERLGYSVVHSIGDVVSATKPILMRSGGLRLLKFLESNNDVTLIVQDVDRLCRNYKDSLFQEEFYIKHNIKIISMSDNIDLSTPSGLLSWRLKQAFSAFYIDNVIQKIRVGVARAKAEGKFLGRKKGSKNKKYNNKNILLK